MDMKGYYTGYKFHVCFFLFAMPLYCLYRDFNFTASMKESPHIPVVYPDMRPLQYLQLIYPSSLQVTTLHPAMILFSAYHHRVQGLSG